MPHKIHIQKLLILILLTQSSIAFAFKLTPIVQTFAHKGKGATKSFKVFNPGNKTILLEIEPKTREIDVFNKESRADSDNFLVYPPQIEVKAGESRSIRVSYIGPQVKHENAYRLIVRQLPSRLKEKNKDSKNNLDFLFEYVASLYVSPGAIKPKINIISAIIKNQKVIIKFENEGTEHTLLKSYKFKLKQGAKSYVIDFKDPKYKKFATYNILAKSKRQILIEAPKSFLTGKTRVFVEKN